MTSNDFTPPLYQMRGGTLTAPPRSRSVPLVSETPPVTDAAPPPEGSTTFELVRRMKNEGATREQVLEKLKANGLDDESAKVLLNSVMGAMPSELPGAQLAPGTNVLSPGVFTLSDIGLTGPPTVVGLFWMGFGAAILVALGIGGLMTATDLVKLPDDVGYYGLRLGGVASMTFIAWGIFRYSQGIVIRRK